MFTLFIPDASHKKGNENYDRVGYYQLMQYLYLFITLETLNVRGKTHTHIAFYNVTV